MRLAVLRALLFSYGTPAESFCNMGFLRQVMSFTPVEISSTTLNSSLCKETTNKQTFVPLFKYGDETPPKHPTNGEMINLTHPDVGQADFLVHTRLGVGYSMVQPWHCDGTRDFSNVDTITARTAASVPPNFVTGTPQTMPDLSSETIESPPGAQMKDTHAPHYLHVVSGQTDNINKLRFETATQITRKHATRGKRNNRIGRESR